MLLTSLPLIQKSTFILVPHINKNIDSTVKTVFSRWFPFFFLSHSVIFSDYEIIPIHVKTQTL